MSMYIPYKVFFNNISNCLGFILAKYDQTLTLDASLEYQTIQGFGASFTDSATINIDSQSAGARNKLLQSYFSTEGTVQ